MSFAQSVISDILTAMDERAVLARHLINKVLLETSQPELAEIEAGNYDCIQNSEILNREAALSGNWYFDVHGEHCLFVNIVTNQELEVSLGNDNFLENLDPYFFYKFLATTKKYQHLAVHFVSPFREMLFLFEELEKQGMLKRLYGSEFRKLGTGATNGVVIITKK
ncbi:MAG TPA: hypothetical protein VF629_25535 [Hymenobacter sp.]|jgi:hypothetical protein|uniref:DUF6896 domain-containing protein n=1 Tax=Hymenobacter sp. TaxID=1898978 RepID=UPI002ED940A4